MNLESKKALRQISEIRGCSWEEARYFCSEIQDYQEDRESSYVDIFEVLQALEKEDSSYSKRELARKAEEITSAKLPHGKPKKPDAPSEIVIDHPRIEKFEGSDQHQAFIDWVDHNSAEGFVLNLRGEGSDPAIHSANCSHLIPDPKQDRVATSQVKLCSTDWNALWSKAHSLAEEKIVLCEYCEV